MCRYEKNIIVLIPVLLAAMILSNIAPTVSSAPVEPVIQKNISCKGKANITAQWRDQEENSDKPRLY